MTRLQPSGRNERRTAIGIDIAQLGDQVGIITDGDGRMNDGLGRAADLDILCERLGRECERFQIVVGLILRKSRHRAPSDPTAPPRRRLSDRRDSFHPAPRDRQMDQACHSHREKAYASSPAQSATHARDATRLPSREFWT